jgi:phenylpropionate dioxygenase-like ring-hydroxylating dioxygenase large terminal subunit
MNVQTAQLTGRAKEQAALLGTAPVPAEPYYSEHYFELEREAVFRRCWLQIGHVSEVASPGDFIVRSIEIARTSVLLTRGVDGTLRAFHNVCTHRGTRLVGEERGCRSSFTCRYHAWTFATDGTLRSAPDFEQFYTDRSDCSLKRIAVDVCAGLIFVNLAEKPAPLREFLGPLAMQLETLPVAQATTFTEYVYEIDANWKLTYDNFQENYHLRFVHSSSSGAGTGPENPFGYPVSYGFEGPHRTMSFWVNPDAQLTPVQQAAFGTLGAAQGARSPSGHDRDYFAIFPNFFMLGATSQNFSHTVMPLSATRSRGVIRIYWIGEDETAARRFGREYAMASLRDIHAEDRSIITWGQEGLSSGALEHIHFQANEVLLRHLYHEVDRRVRDFAATAVSSVTPHGVPA